MQIIMSQLPSIGAHAASLNRCTCRYMLSQLPSIGAHADVLSQLPSIGTREIYLQLLLSLEMKGWKVSHTCQVQLENLIRKLA